jgi:hypothetical protein
MRHGADHVALYCPWLSWRMFVTTRSLELVHEPQLAAVFANSLRRVTKTQPMYAADWAAAEGQLAKQHNSLLRMLTNLRLWSEIRLGRAKVPGGCTYESIVSSGFSSMGFTSADDYTPSEAYDDNYDSVMSWASHELRNLGISMMETRQAVKRVMIGVGGAGAAGFLEATAAATAAKVLELLAYQRVLPLWFDLGVYDHSDHDISLPPVGNDRHATAADSAMVLAKELKRPKNSKTHYFELPSEFVSLREGAAGSTDLAMHVLQASASVCPSLHLYVVRALMAPTSQVNVLLLSGSLEQMAVDDGSFEQQWGEWGDTNKGGSTSTCCSHAKWWIAVAPNVGEDSAGWTAVQPKLNEVCYGGSMMSPPAIQQVVQAGGTTTVGSSSSEGKHPVFLLVLAIAECIALEATGKGGDAAGVNSNAAALQLGMRRALNPENCNMPADCTPSWIMVKAETDRIRQLTEGSFTVALSSIAMMGEVLVLLVQQCICHGDEPKPMQLARESVERYLDSANTGFNGRDHFLANLLIAAGKIQANGCTVERHPLQGQPFQLFSHLGGGSEGSGQFMIWALQSLPLLKAIKKLLLTGKARVMVRVARWTPTRRAGHRIWSIRTTPCRTRG